MRVISLVNQKGGVGKSTLSLNLAHCFATGLKVGLMDTDAQGSIRNMSDTISGIDILTVSDLPAIKKASFDVVVIDTPPYVTNHLDAILEASDFVLIPVKPSYVDVMAVKPTCDFIFRKQAVKPALIARIVLNMVKPRTSVNQDITFLLDNMPIATMKSTVSERVAFIRSFINNGVFQGEDERATNEIIDVAEEITKLLKQ
jgi:chromosome partitioning protein